MSAATPPPALHADPIDTPGSRLDLTQARFGPDGANLALALTTARPWRVAELAPQRGRSLCVLLFTKTAKTRVCAVPGDATRPLALRWSRLNAAGHPVQSRTVAGSVSHPDTRTLRATFAPEAVSLQPGLFRWRAQARWDAADVDVVPNAGSIPARLADTSLPTGCTPNGPGEHFSGAPGQKRIALTFDDGPDTPTPRFLDLLEREHTPATFFMIGRQVAAHASLLKRMLRDGDMIGNHTWSHANVGLGGATAQIAETNAAIRAASGFTPCLFRPPYGASSPALVAEVEAAGMRSIRWNVDPADWKSPGVEAIVANVLANAHDGAIVLSHDGGGARDQTIAAYERIIPALRARGYKLVTVTDLLGYPLVHGA